MKLFDKKKCGNIEVPYIGLGTWKINDKNVMNNVIHNAYDCGYRLFDTAASYTNEIVLGSAIKDLNVSRDKVLITDKVWNTNRGYSGVQNALKVSLKKLKLDYVDIYLMHWPASMVLYQNWKEINAETWRGMEDLLKDGLVRAIGVCNYKIHHLEELIKTARIIPMINQIEFHPGYVQNEIYEYCRTKNIIVEASSPLSKGELLSNKILIDIAKKYNKTVAQIVLRWELQKGIIVIPKTIKDERLKENIDIFDFDISDNDMMLIENLECECGEKIDSDTVVTFG